MKKIKIIVIFLLVQASNSFGATTPDLLGSWIAVSGYFSSTGTPSAPAPVIFSKYSLVTEILISDQENSAFSGISFLINGEKRNIAGVLQTDDKSIYISQDNAILIGHLSLDNTQMVLCGSNVLTNINTATCGVFNKTK